MSLCTPPLRAMTLAPLRPDWDLDDPEFAPEPSEDDYEYVDPDAVPTRVIPPDRETEIPVAPI